MHQIQLGQVLDVAAVERELSLLWQDSAAKQSDEGAVMRARVANLIVFMPDRSQLQELDATLQELSAVHPNRTLVNIGVREADDRDIELFISSFYQSGQEEKRLSCEEIILIARGRFVPELPSAALPLLISDLPTFLWWRDTLETDDRIFQDFARAADRLIIDSLQVRTARDTLLALAEAFSDGQPTQLAISDINWARLTSWRALLASFYDAPRCQTPLNRITGVEIDYSPPEHEPEAIAPQALMLAGWLASRLKWELSTEPVQPGNSTVRFFVLHDGRRIVVDLNRIERAATKPGRLARAQLNAGEDDATFVVSRHSQGLHLETQARLAGITHPGKILTVRNRSTAQLLGRELEILSHDSVYERAVEYAAKILRYIR